MQARYQNPAIGRFVSQDPSFLNIGVDRKNDYIQLSQPQKLNSYSYVENNPISMKDPDGKEGMYSAFITQFNYTNNQTGGAFGTMMQNAWTGAQQGALAAGMVCADVAALTVATLVPGAAPYIHSAVTNTSVRAYNDLQDDGMINDGVGAYLGSIGFGAAGGRLTDGKLTLTTLGISAGLTAWEDQAVDGKVRMRNIVNNTGGLLMSKLTGGVSTMAGGGSILNSFAQSAGQVGGTIGSSLMNIGGRVSGYVPANMRQSISSYTGSLTDWARGKKSK